MNDPKNAVLMPNPVTPCIPITFTDRCIGCNTCVNACRSDVLMPNPERGKEPLVVYPDECWMCGCCVDDCLVEGASVFHHPLLYEVPWKDKATGKLYRVGQANELLPVANPFYDGQEGGR